MHSLAKNSEFANSSSAYVAGQLSGILVVSVAAAWGLYRLLGRSSWAASITLPLVFLLSLYSVAKGVFSDINDEKAMIMQLEKDLHDAKTPEERLNVARSAIESIAPELALIVEETKILFKKPAEEFVAAQDVVVTERFLSKPQLLASTETATEYRWQKETVVHYIDTAEAYQAAIITILEKIDASSSSRLSGSATKGFRSAIVKAKEHVDSHIVLARLYAQLLDILGSEHGRWKLDGDWAVFSSQERQHTHDTIIDAIVKAEETTRKLTLNLSR